MELVHAFKNGPKALGWPGTRLCTAAPAACWHPSSALLAGQHVPLGTQGVGLHLRSSLLASRRLLRIGCRQAGVLRRALRLA